MSENTPFTFNDDGSFNLPGGQRIATDGGMESVLKELGEGYLRQSDYTRKTQDLSLQQKELENAGKLMDQLRTNPAGTLKSLAKNLGVELGTPPPPPSAPPRQSDGWDDEWDDAPQDRGTSVQDPRIEQLFEAVQALSDQVNGLGLKQTKSQVEAEVQSLQSTFAEKWGIQVEPEMLMRYATANGIPDLTVAANSLYMDDIVEASRTPAKATSEDDAQVIEQKRDASQAIRPGVGSAGEGPGTKVPGDDGELDWSAAMKETLSELGVGDVRDLSFDDAPRSTY